MKEHYLENKVDSLFHAEHLAPVLDGRLTEDNIKEILAFMDREIYMANIELAHKVTRMLYLCLKEKL